MNKQSDSIRKKRLALETRLGGWKPATGPVKVAVAYPNTYPVAMGNLGFLAVFQALCTDGRFTAERVCLPEDDGPPVSMESGRSLIDFDVIAFSVSFEGDYTNLAKMLFGAGLPLFSSERKKGYPLVVAGGVAIGLNPEPVSDLLDAAILGESEGALAPFLDFLMGNRRLLGDRDSILEGLRDVPHVYIPSGYRFVLDQAGSITERQVKSGFPDTVALARAPLFSAPVVSPLLTPESAFGEMAVVETVRGCGNHCRFCAAGFHYLPPRPGSSGQVEQAIGSVPEGVDIGLLGTAVSDHGDLKRFIQCASTRGGKVSLSSIRAGNLDSEMYRLLAASGLKQVALAPETGTTRLRHVLNKDQPDEIFLKECDLLGEAGIYRVKLYFMIGLPTETETDIKAICSLTRAVRDRLKNASTGKGKIVRVDLSVNPFVPKPQTPFQWQPMAGEAYLKKAIARVRAFVRKEKGISCSFESVRLARMQAVLSVGDRRLAGVLADMAKQGMGWKQALRSHGLKEADLIERKRENEEIFPWDWIDSGVSKKRLARELLAGLDAKLTPGCEVGTCHRCRACSRLEEKPDM